MTSPRKKREREANNEKPEQTSQTSLSADVISLIATYTSPKKRIVGSVSRSFRIGFYRADQAQFQKHFPHLYKAYKKSGTTDWCSALVEAMQTQHHHNLRYQHAFYHTKESNLDDLIKMDIQFQDLVALDKAGITLATWARISANQAVRDHYFQIVVAHYASHTDNADITDIHRDEVGNTLLHWAIIFTQPHDAVRQMITATGFDVNATNAGGMTPLLLSIHKDTTSYTALLLDLGANIEIRNIKDVTPLVSAVLESAHKTVKLLLDRDADIHAKCQTAEFTALSYAAWLGDLTCTKVLLDPKYKGNVNVRSLERTPLLIAAYRGQTDLVNLLLEHGADLFAVTSNDETAVYAAAMNGHTDTLRTLFTACDRRANVIANKCTTANKSPLVAATNSGNITCMQILIAYGARMNLLLPEYHATALMMAAENHAHDALLRLIEVGAEVNFACPNSGITALHMAAVTDNNTGLECLLMAGADQSLKATFTAADLIKLYEDINPYYVPNLRIRLQSYPDKTSWTAEELANLIEADEILETLERQRETNRLKIHPA